MTKFKLESKITTSNLLSFFFGIWYVAICGNYWLVLISTSEEMISLIKLDSVTVEIKVASNELE